MKKKTAQPIELNLDENDESKWVKLSVEKTGAKVKSTGPQWFRVMVPNGTKYGESCVMRALKQNCAVPFTPYHISTTANNKHILFYVNDQTAAKALNDINKQIEAPGGGKILVVVVPSKNPFLKDNAMDDGTEFEKHRTKEKLTTAMSRRYHSATNALNLAELHNDAYLKVQNIQAKLHSPDITKQILAIIKENIPNLAVLDVSKNKLCNLVGLKKSAPNLTALNLADNNLSDITELKKLVELKDLKEIYLKGNGLCHHYLNKKEYFHAIKTILPQLDIIDGEEANVTCTANPDGNASNTSTANPVAEDKIMWFLRDYYDVFDSEDRRPLAGAYQEGSNLVIKFLSNPALSVQHKSTHSNMNIWGKSIIVAALVEYPKTQHLGETIQLNEVSTTDDKITFKVTGIFRENGAIEVLRHFERTFVTSPMGDGMIILEDRFLVTNPGEEHVKQAPKDLQTKLIRQQMVAELMAKTQMNMQYSHKCLSECAWDFARAQQSFLLAKDKGLIPAEAFKKKQ